MGKFYDDIPEFLIEFIEKQHMFWVASAPLSGEGHVNASPKGLDGAFHVVNSHQVWYEDCTGSGSETIAHMREPGNARITILFNAFEGPPRIARLFGKGTVHEYGTPEYERLLPIEKRKAGSRAAIVVDVHKAGTSCGFAVPFYEFKCHRTLLENIADKKETVDMNTEQPLDGPPPLPAGGLKGYWATVNAQSIDGLPSMEVAFKSPAKFIAGQKVYKKDFIGFKSQTGGDEEAKVTLSISRLGFERARVFLSGAAAGIAMCAAVLYILPVKSALRS